MDTHNMDTHNMDTHNMDTSINRAIIIVLSQIP